MKINKILLIIILQIISLFAILAHAYAPLYFGKEIRVSVNLYDPRDLLRGNYVKLEYDFSNVNDSLLQGKKIENGKIYAILKQNEEGLYELERHTYEKPSEGIFLEGRGDYNTIHFGIEAFFLPVEKAKKMEKDIWEKGAIAFLSVMNNGKVRVKNIQIK